MLWATLQVSPCQTHHVDMEGDAIYQERYDLVLPFHAPGLAPVRSAGKAWHITAEGSAVYCERYQRTFGYYCQRAAVVNDDGWSHICSNGDSAYPQKYAWVGNYQSDVCTVRDSEGWYYHIDLNGQPLYNERWRYCGDFRESIAVVQNDEGKSTHISKNGQLLHGQWFDDLDVYHKGFARALFLSGWAHVDKNGHAVYTCFYANIEPFYNGFARVEKFDGSIIIINEQGEEEHQLRRPTLSAFSELSADLVGFWRTMTLGAATEVGIMDVLPATVSSIALGLQLNHQRTERLMWALTELGVVRIENGVWQPTDKGVLLQKSHPKTLSDAASEYQGNMLQRWKELPSLLRGEKVQQDIFNQASQERGRCERFHRMLSSYAKHDYQGLIPLLNINPGQSVLDAAGGDGTLSGMLAMYYPRSSIICADLPNVIEYAKPSAEFRYHGFDIFCDWQIRVDIIILARVLHDWDDKQVQQILERAKNSLHPGGEVIVLEMMRDEHSAEGALCDMHLLAVTGGQERTGNHYRKLLQSAGLLSMPVERTKGLVSILRAGKG